MAFYKQDIVDINLNTGNIHRSFLSHAIGYKNDDADRFGIRTFRDGVPQDLTGASCQAVFMAPNGSKIALTSYGTVSGNVAYVTLPPACYDYEGQFCLSIQLVGGGVTGTMRIVDGMVVNTGASGTVAPTSAVPTYQEIIAQYDAMVAATAAANGAIAATYSGSATYKVGDYCIHDGGLYRCTTAITTAEAWNAAHWTATKIGPDVSDLKSAFDSESRNVEKEIFEYNTKTIAQSPLSFVAGSIIDNGNTKSSDTWAMRQTNATLFKAKFGDYIKSTDASYIIRVAYYSTNTIASGNLVKITQYTDEVYLDPNYYFALCIANASMTGTISSSTAQAKVVYNNAVSMIEESVNGELIPLSNSDNWSKYTPEGQSDLNANYLSANKIYQVTYSTDVLNLPITPFSGTIITFDYDTNASVKSMVMLAFKNSGEIYKRMLWGSTWKAWNQIPVIDNVISSNIASINSAASWATYSNDMDNLGINKIYQIAYNKDGNDDPIAHLPVSGFLGNVITFDYDPSSASKTQIQLAFARSGKTYRRMMWGATWANWYEFANMDDIPNVGTAYKGLGDFIACGDSNTVSLSYPTADHGIPVKSWATSLAEMIGSDCDIYAAGGRSTAGFINSDDYAPAIADTKQFAILYLGINDCSQSVDIETFTSNYTIIVNALLTNHKFVFCINIPEAVQPSSRRTQYNTAIASVCSSISKAFLVDITGCSDRIAVYKNVGHLSSIGYAVLAGEIAQAINKTMSENDYFDAQIDVDSN